MQFLPHTKCCIRVAKSIIVESIKGQEYAVSSVQFSSVAQSCPTLCDPMNRSTPGLPVHHQLPEFTQTHIHRVSDAIQPFHPPSSPSPPAPNLSQHQSLLGQILPPSGTTIFNDSPDWTNLEILEWSGGSSWKVRCYHWRSWSDKFHQDVQLVKIFHMRLSWGHRVRHNWITKHSTAQTQISSDTRWVKITESSYEDHWKRKKDSWMLLSSCPHFLSYFYR